MPAQKQRPFPLVCEHCLTVIGADELCTWRELPAVPGALTISSGYVGTHDDCPERAFEHWSSKRAQHLPLDEISSAVEDGKTRDLFVRHGYLTEIDLEFAARLRAKPTTSS